ncbi:uncharacterized protein LOC126756139 [Bactrocera neohumeralis]|uniref:uncharacterized protein LOC126756139 n=1 Tax=Bactrocera neohumeralis TaxID=98809 RepID=UPI0021669707|nr:uncharacterized protein LOC126756139 [Bactrocera neohumeralis]
MTKMECKPIDKTLLRLNVCRLKAVKRDVTEATVRVQLQRPVDNCDLHVELLRKYTSYQPFFINKTFDACEFLKTRKNAVYFDILFKLLANYTNANHTCPYDGEFIVERFRPFHNNLMLPLPTGDYLIKFVFYTSNAMIFQLLVWFGFKELDDWESRRKFEWFPKTLHTP